MMFYNHDCILVFFTNENIIHLQCQVIWWFVLAVMCVFGLLYGFHAVRTQRGFIDPPQELGKWSFMTVKLSLSLLEKGCGKLATLVNFEVHITLSCQYNYGN